MWFREFDRSAVTRALKAPHATTIFLVSVIFALAQGAPALASEVGQNQNESRATQAAATVVPAPAVEPLYPTVELPAAARHDGVFAIPASTLAESVTSAAPRSAVARFADDGDRPSLLDTATPPVSSASQSLIPPVQAFAAATAAGDLGNRMIFDAPDNESESPQQLIPLPPAGWTGMMGLVSLGVVGKLRRLRRRF
jgi:hypothetical protein